MHREGLVVKRPGSLVKCRCWILSWGWGSFPFFEQRFCRTFGVLQNLFFNRLSLREMFCRTFLQNSGEPLGAPARLFRPCKFFSYHWVAIAVKIITKKYFTEVLFRHSYFRNSYKAITLQSKFLRMFSCKQGRTSGSNITKNMFWWNYFCNKHKDYHKRKNSKELCCNSVGQDGCQPAVKRSLAEGVWQKRAEKSGKSVRKSDPNGDQNEKSHRTPLAHRICGSLSFHFFLRKVLRKLPKVFGPEICGSEKTKSPRLIYRERLPCQEALKRDVLKGDIWKWNFAPKSALSHWNSHSTRKFSLLFL